MTVNELENNEKLKYWYSVIMKCKQSDMSIKAFCKANHIAAATYYAYQKKIKEILCDSLENKTEEVKFLSVDVSNNSCQDNIIVLTKGPVKIEFDCHTDYESIESLIKALLC